MKNKVSRVIVALLLVSLSIFVIACGGDNADGNNNNNDNNNDVENVNNNNENENNGVEETEDPEEITLVFDYPEEEDFIEDIKGPVEEKFPHITLEYYEDVLEDIEDAIVTNTVPDIYYMSGGDKVEILEEYEVAYDLTELIDKTGFDLSVIIEENVDIVRKWSDGAFYYMPFEKRWEALYYNKDIFDKFGEDYPVDGMTWDEVTNLARKVTGEIGGERYRGIEMYDANAMLQQLEVNHVDPETDESLYDSDERFHQFLEKVEVITSIPGVLAEGEEESGVGGFITDQNVAMMPLFDAHLWFAGVEEDTGLNWDMVSFPVWEEHPDRGTLVNAAGFAITDISEHKEAAFEVLAYIASDEWQMMRAKKGFSPVSSNPEVQEAFASEVDTLKDKNMLAPYYLTESTGPEKWSKYEQDGDIISIEDFVEKGQDINTYLRELAEEANGIIQEIKGSE